MSEAARASIREQIDAIETREDLEQVLEEIRLLDPGSGLQEQAVMVALQRGVEV